MKAKIEKLMVFLIPTDQVVGDFSQSMIKSDKLLGRQNVDFLDVTDDFLIRWTTDMQEGTRVCADQAQDPSKNNKNAVLSIDNSVINQRISAVVSFYLWCKEARRVPPSIVGAPGEIEQGTFQITVKRNAETNELGWAYPLKSTRSSRQPTPTNTEVQQLHQQIEKKHTFEVSARNRLIVDWMESEAVREVEVASLRVDQIPDRVEIDRLMETEERHHFVLSEAAGNKTKGGYERDLYVCPLLLGRTLDYIEFVRPEIVERFMEKSSSYKEPPQIFLSTTTGGAIAPKTLANELGDAFKEASISGSPHGLRRKSALDVVERLYLGALQEKEDHRKIDESTIIFQAKEILGHKQAGTSLKHYIDLTKLKVLSMSKAQRFAYAEKRAANAAKLLEDREARLLLIQEKLSSHENLLNAIQKGDKDHVFKLVNSGVPTLNQKLFITN